MMEASMRRKQTYEEVLDYIVNNNDKIVYPNRTAKLLRNTFQLSKLDGDGQAILEQQQADELKHRFKDTQLRQLAIQNDTDVRTEAILQGSSEQQPAIQQAASSSSGVRNIMGSVVGGVTSMIRNPFGGQQNQEPDQEFHTPTEAARPEPIREEPPAKPRGRQKTAEIAKDNEEAINHFTEDEINERVKQHIQNLKFVMQNRQKKHF